MLKLGKVAAGALAVILLSGVVFSDAALAGSTTSYSSSYGKSSDVQGALIKPKWQVTTDYMPYKKGHDAIAGDGIVYYAGKNKLVAADLQTGKTRFTYAAQLQVPPVLSNSSLFAATSEGRLVRLDGKSGKVIWQTQVGPKRSKLSAQVSALQGEGNSFIDLKVANGKVVVSTVQELAVYDAAKGTKLWSTSQEAGAHGYYAQEVGEQVLVVSQIVSGAITTTYYSGYELNKGTKLWELKGDHVLIGSSQGGYLYMRDTWPALDQGYAAKVDKVNLFTGKVEQSFSYEPVKDAGPESARDVVMDSDYLYITLQDGSVKRYFLDADPVASSATTYSLNAQFLTGPYDDKLFYQSGVNLVGKQMTGSKIITYQGVNNLISRLDLIGKGAYVGQVDGQLMMLDVQTGKSLGRVATGARTYGRTMVHQGMVLIQAENKLIAAVQPAALRKPLDTKQTVSYKKAQAVVSMNGKEAGFTPEAVSIGNSIYLPLEQVVTQLGGTVDEKNTQSGQLQLTLGDQSVTVQAGSLKAAGAKGELLLKSEPVLIEGALYIASGELRQLLGLSVEWNGGSRTLQLKL